MTTPTRPPAAPVSSQAARPEVVRPVPRPVMSRSTPAPRPLPRVLLLGADTLALVVLGCAAEGATGPEAPSAPPAPPPAVLVLAPGVFVEEQRWAAPVPVACARDTTIGPALVTWAEDRQRAVVWRVPGTPGGNTSAAPDTLALGCAGPLAAPVERWQATADSLVAP